MPINKFTDYNETKAYGDIVMLPKGAYVVQIKGKEQLLSVIPTKGTNTMFFGVNSTVFSEVKVNGEKKVAIFLNKGNNMPGTLDLTITSAGGTFKKTIQVWDNPYIDSMDFNIPDLYEGEESDEFTFSAKDQYEKDVSLYDFVPEAGYYDTTQGKQVAENTLYFRDMNHLGNQVTRIQASDAGKWRVEKDTAKKTFHVYYKPANKAKAVVTFTMITAGAKTKTQNVTVGEVGTAGQIEGSSSSIQLTSGDEHIFGAELSFKDANGKTMERFDANNNYPYFLNDEAIKTHVQGKDEKLTHFFWTLSEEKMPTDSADKAIGIKLDNDGTVVTNDDAKQNQDELFVGAKLPTTSFYITLLGGTSKDATNLVVLDSEAFRFNYVPTSYENLKFTVLPVSGLLYSGGYGHGGKKVYVKVTNAAGESWTVPATSLVAEAPFETVGNVIKSADTNDLPNTDGEVEVKVYVNVGDKSSGAVDTIKIKYSNRKPVGTTTYFAATTGNGGTRSEDKTNAAFGYGVDKTWFTTSSTAGAASEEDGVLTLTNANGYNDTFKAAILDQYGVTMADTEIKVNGDYMSNATIEAGKQMNFVLANGKAKLDFTAVAGKNGYSLTKPTWASTSYVSTQAQFLKALSDDTDAIQLADGFRAVIASDTTIKKPIYVNNGSSLTVNSDLTLEENIIVEDGGKLTFSGENRTLDGTPEQKGIIVLKGGSEFEVGNGTFEEIKIEDGEVLVSTMVGVTVPATPDSATVKTLTITETGHGTLVAGKLNNSTAVDIKGTSLEILAGATFEIAKAAKVTNLVLGTNNGTLVVNDEAALVKALTTPTTNGVVTAGEAITLKNPITITAGADKAVVLKTDSAKAITTDSTNKLVVAADASVQITGTQQTGLNVENEGKLVIGNGKDDVKVDDLKVTSADAATSVSAAATVGKTDAESKGDIKYEAGSKLGSTEVVTTGTVPAKTEEAKINEEVAKADDNAIKTADEFLAAIANGAQKVVTLGANIKLGNDLEVKNDLGEYSAKYHISRYNELTIALNGYDLDLGNNFLSVETDDNANKTCRLVITGKGSVISTARQTIMLGMTKKSAASLEIAGNKEKKADVTIVNDNGIGVLVYGSAEKQDGMDLSKLVVNNNAKVPYGAVLSAGKDPVNLANVIKLPNAGDEKAWARAGVVGTYDAAEAAYTENAGVKEIKGDEITFDEKAERAFIAFTVVDEKNN